VSISEPLRASQSRYPDCPKETINEPNVGVVKGEEKVAHDYVGKKDRDVEHRPEKLPLLSPHDVNRSRKKESESVVNYQK
jgi:hypothetical protein